MNSLQQKKLAICVEHMRKVMEIIYDQRILGIYKTLYLQLENSLFKTKIDELENENV